MKETRPANVNNTRPIVDADEEALADEDADLEGEGEKIFHAEVESIGIRMVTAHIPGVCVKHPGWSIRRKKPLKI